MPAAGDAVTIRGATIRRVHFPYCPSPTRFVLRVVSNGRFFEIVIEPNALGLLSCRERRVVYDRGVR